jgi:phospholipid/cholesterol/gamma-HCH transport system ATP-binding protein
MVQNQQLDHPARLVLDVADLSVTLGRNQVLKNLNLSMAESEILGVVGPSGTGKSVLLRTILGLVQPQGGTVDLLGERVVDADRPMGRGRSVMWRSVGVLFQHGALFSSLTLAENIMVPMREALDISEGLMADLARMKLRIVGLDPQDASKYPAELSGGMVKRAALARALALEPKLLFVDEPTSGLDPIGADGFDVLIGELRDTLGLSVYMVTHDLDSLHQICDRIAVLGEGRVLVDGSAEYLHQEQQGWVEEYFNGPRGSRFLRTVNEGAVV